MPIPPFVQIVKTHPTKAWSAITPPRRAVCHPVADEDIFHPIRNGVPGADMPPTPLPDEQTWNLVAFIHALIGPASENKVPGNPEAGERIFRSSNTPCSD